MLSTRRDNEKKSQSQYGKKINEILGYELLFVCRLGDYNDASK